MLAPAIRALLLIWLSALGLVVSVCAQAQRGEVTFEDAKARLLGAVLDNTTWPDEESFDEFIVGVYRGDDALLRALNERFEGTRVRDKSVSVRGYSRLLSARAAHILVLPRSVNSDLARVDRELRQSQTLMVTDAATDKTDIMVNFTYPTKASLAFEINAANIIYAGLNLSKNMLMFAGSKVDLAAVYEEMESNLVRAKAVASQQQTKLEEQQRMLGRQQVTIAEQRAEVAQNRDELSALDAQLQEVQQVLATSEEQLAQNAAELEAKERILAEKEAYIDGYSQRIEQNLARLEEQQKAIDEQERQILAQESELVNQLDTIENQRFILIATVSALLLFLLLIGLIFRAYRGKHLLARQLEGKTLELGVANEKLLQVTEAKSRFLSTMSHEIRTPMNGVIGMAELLEGTDLSRQQSEYVSLIIKSADTLLGLINDILDFSKIEAGRLDLESTPFGLREVLGDTLQTLSPRANEKGLELTFHIPPGVPDRVIGDPLRLRQVMVNLVGNAIKFTDDGEVDVDLSLDTSSAGQARILFEVRDTGIGISASAQKQIFEAFGQADSSTTRQFGGTGLGLAIAGQLVQMMGGTLSVRSQPGEGSTFYFTADLALPDGPAPLSLQPEELRDLRVLVVDDNSTNRLILEELLGSWGMQVDAVDGGEAALAGLATDKLRTYAVALLDVMMPHMDGYDLARRIRQMEMHSAMRILMLTSAGRSNTTEIRRRLDISRVLLKPIKHSDLLSAITEELGLSSEEQVAHEFAGEDVVARRVLLVEDNAVNRKVALELLERRGHQVEVASNGAEALDEIARQQFDVVLMDVHMPVMDGLAAARKVREHERGGDSRLPIIALTAGATVEDRQNAAEAGMDGFMTKPFRANELFAAVEAVASPVVAGSITDTGASGESGPTAAPTSVPAADAPDEPCLDWAGALRNLEGDEELLGDLAQMFLRQCPKLLAAVEEAVSKRTADDLRNAAHSLKGSCQVIGGRAAAASALRLERMGRESRLERAEGELRALQEALDELRAALEAESPAIAP